MSGKPLLNNLSAAVVPSLLLRPKMLGDGYRINLSHCSATETDTRHFLPLPMNCVENQKPSILPRTAIPDYL